MKRGILSDLIIAYLLEEQNTLCTPPAGGKSQSSGNSSSANSASVSSFSFSITTTDSSRRAVSSGTRLGLIHELRLMQCYLMPDETALRELSEGVIEKLKLLTDAEFAELEFPPD